MKISSKGRYALRTMVDIARNKDEFIPLSDISSRQNISLKYLESVIAILVKAGLLVSMRGASGGYKLAKKPSECTVREILSATGDTPEFVSCTKGGETDCPMVSSCDTAGCWSALTDLINGFLEKVTLQDLIDKTFNSKE